jgi:hypothetical protein
MDLQKFFLVFVFLFICLPVCLPVCFGQNQTERPSMDDFETLTGDNLQGRIDNFVKALSQNNSRGLIILYAPKGGSILRYIFEGRVKGCFKMWKIDESNIAYIFAEGRDDIYMQFWEIPPKAPPPELTEVPHDYKLADLSKPVMIDNLYKKVVYCPLSFDMKFYARFLKANPNIDAKIVIYEKTLTAYEKERLKYFQELTESEQIPPQRITFVKGKFNSVPDAEFWLVPVKKK